MRPCTQDPPDVPEMLGADEVADQAKNLESPNGDNQGDEGKGTVSQKKVDKVKRDKKP